MEEAENNRRSSSDESNPEEIDSRLLRKQLLEVSGKPISFPCYIMVGSWRK